ncbi:MAG: cation-transporting P-type ATPase, partial [Candidatus Geothermincolales bacterium]
MAEGKKGERASECSPAHCWHTMGQEEVERALSTSVERGLSAEEARRRLSFHGPNILKEERPTHPIALFLRQ